MAGGTKRRKDFLFESAKTTVLLFVFFGLPQHTQVSGSKLNIINLRDGEQSERSEARHFCYLNTITPGWRETWTSIQVRVWSSQQLKVTVVEDEEMLQELEQFSLWGMLQHLMKEPTNETTVPIGLFRQKTCFKIDPVQPNAQYTVKPVRKFDVFLFAVFLAGALLFLFADSLSRSQVFYYSAGMSTGMIASLIIFIFIIGRFLPKKSPFYILMVGGWSFSVYIIQLVYANLQIILREHWHLALGYTAVVGFISFAVCYRHGPLVEEKSINILSWSLQLFGLLLIYAGIQVQQVALALILAAFCAKNLEHPAGLAVSLWRKLRPAPRWKPAPRQLLTEEEFRRQGLEETQVALEGLRQHCGSPEFSTWRTVSRLQSPKRFADFVEGSTHLISNEVSVHAQEYGLRGSYYEDELFATDEEDDDDDDDEEEEDGETLDHLKGEEDIGWQ